MTAMTHCKGLPGYPATVMGVMNIAPDETVAAVHAAIDLGYRAFDTAPVYYNEEAVGEALRTAAVPREELFVTTKLWNSCHGFDEALAAYDRTLARLGLDYVDLYLIHWPVPTRGRTAETWKALVRLRDEGRVRAIGVSNFLPEHLDAIIEATGVVPAVNQIEMHPGMQQAELRAAHARLGIATQAWSPLGRGAALAGPELLQLAATHGRSPAQIVLRWLAQLGVTPVVKSRDPGRMAQNLAIQDFRLSDDEMARIGTLDQGQSLVGVDPRTFDTMERFAGFNP